MAARTRRVPLITPVPPFVRAPLGEETRLFQNICPHSGGPLTASPIPPLSRDGDHLVCQTHGALFRIRDGLCVAGPCLGARLTPWSGEPDRTEASR